MAGRRNIRIVRATSRDLPRLERLFEQIEREEGAAPHGPAVPGLRRSLASFDLLGSDGAWLLAAETEADLVGYTVAVRVPKLDGRLGYVFVDELHVLREHRRDGVATALLDAVGDLVQELGYHGVRLLVRPENAAARHLYARLGFTEQPSGFCERVR